jgi:hypothetical protein
MKIFNNTSFDVIAFVWHKYLGQGKEVTIKSGESDDVHGLSLKAEGESRGGCHLALSGDIICHEEEDNLEGCAFQVLQGHQLDIDAKVVKGCAEVISVGVTIRHHLDKLALSTED